MSHHSLHACNLDDAIYLYDIQRMLRVRYKYIFLRHLKEEKGNGRNDIHNTWININIIFIAIRCSYKFDEQHTFFPPSLLTITSAVLHNNYPNNLPKATEISWITFGSRSIKNRSRIDRVLHIKSRDSFLLDSYGILKFQAQIACSAQQRKKERKERKEKKRTVQMFV